MQAYEIEVLCNHGVGNRGFQTDVKITKTRVQFYVTTCSTFFARSHVVLGTVKRCEAGFPRDIRRGKIRTESSMPKIRGACAYEQCEALEDEHLVAEPCTTCSKPVHHFCSNALLEGELAVRVCSEIYRDACCLSTATAKRGTDYEAVSVSVTECTTTTSATKPRKKRGSSYDPARRDPSTIKRGRCPKPGAMMSRTTAALGSITSLRGTRVKTSQITSQTMNASGDTSLPAATHMGRNINLPSPVGDTTVDNHNSDDGSLHDGDEENELDNNGRDKQGCGVDDDLSSDGAAAISSKSAAKSKRNKASKEKA